MKIVADSKIPFVREAFAEVAEVVALETQEITHAAVLDADALLVRSETHVGRDLLKGTRVRFVGTSTIGTDHVDTSYLEQQQISFASAPGSNANSVAEYIVASLLVLSKRLGFDLKGKTLGIVGVGNVGSIVARYAEALSLNVLQNDPPLARKTGNPVYKSLDDLMKADMITLHVPLTKSGPDTTYHLFDRQRIGQMKEGSILINTSRGSVVETEAIRNAMRTGHLRGVVLDVWEKEPTIDADLVSVVTLGTPHIAGYSYDGKVNGIVMIHKAACEHFGWHSTWNARGAMEKRVAAPISLPANSAPGESLLAAIRQCYDIETDNRNLRGMLEIPAAERGAFFRRLRSRYPIRWEFSHHEVLVPAQHKPLVRVLKALGFHDVTLQF